eukprot:g6486.t1
MNQVATETSATNKFASAPNVVLGPHAPAAPPVPLTGRSISSRAVGPEPQLPGKEFSLVHEGLEMISFFNIDTGEHLHTLPAAANLRQFVKYLNARAAVVTSQGTAPAREVMRFEYANATVELLPNPEDETDADTVMQMKMSPTNTDPHGDGMGISRRPVTNCGELAEYLFRQVRQRSVRFVPRSLHGVGLPGPAAGDSVPKLTVRDIHAHIDVQFREEVPVVMKVAEEQVATQKGAPARSSAREVGVAREGLRLPVSMLVREVTEFFENPVYESRVRGYVSKFQYLVEDFSAVTNGPRKVEVVAAEWRRDNDEAFEVTAYDLRALANLLWDRIDLSKMRHGEKPSIDQVRRNITAVLTQMPGPGAVEVGLPAEKNQHYIGTPTAQDENFHDIGRTVPSTPTPAGGSENMGLRNSSVVSAGTIVPAGPSVGPVPSHDGSTSVNAGAIVPAMPRPGQETVPQTVAPDITSATVVPAALLSSAPSQAGVAPHPTLIGPAIHRKLEVRSTVLPPQGQEKEQQLLRFRLLVRSQNYNRSDNKILLRRGLHLCRPPPTPAARRFLTIWFGSCSQRHDASVRSWTISWRSKGKCKVVEEEILLMKRRSSPALLRRRQKQFAWPNHLPLRLVWLVVPKMNSHKC